MHMFLFVIERNLVVCSFFLFTVLETNAYWTFVHTIYHHHAMNNFDQWGNVS